MAGGADGLSIRRHRSRALGRLGPGEEINPAVVEAMASSASTSARSFPKPLTDEVVHVHAGRVITMGCGDACPIYPGKRYLDWELEIRPARSRDRARSATRSTPRAGACSPSSSPAARVTFAGRLAARALGAFALVFFGAARSWSTPRAVGSARSASRSRSAWRCDDDLRARPRLGAHFNPAVSFGFALTRHFPWSGVVGYRAAQVAGAVAAACSSIFARRRGERRRDGPVRSDGRRFSGRSCSRSSSCS